MTPGRSIVLVGVLLALTLVATAEARSHFTGKKGPSGEQDEPRGREAERRMTIRPSGLVPVLPREAACPDIASPFGSGSRYDGSRRPADRFGGLHGGIDISLDEGTPLRAIAAGKVISSGTGGIATGIYLWVQHSPDDTGLPFWVYSKYQHFRNLPELEVGDAVKVGQVVGLSGRTGTAGRHYGPSGYPHLHLTTFAGPSDRYEIQDSSVVAAMSKIFDPVAFYLPELRDVDDVERLPRDGKKVAIPYIDEDGSVHPAGSRRVWPVACKRRSR